MTAATLTITRHDRDVLFDLLRRREIRFGYSPTVSHHLKVLREAGVVASCCGHGAALSDEEAQLFGAAPYDEGAQSGLPDTATMASLGCGNPTAVAQLNAGETVLDLGSGEGSTFCSQPSGSVRPALGKVPEHYQEPLLMPTMLAIAASAARARERLSPRMARFAAGYLRPLSEAASETRSQREQGGLL